MCAKNIGRKIRERKVCKVCRRERKCNNENEKSDSDI